MSAWIEMVELIGKIKMAKDDLISVSKKFDYLVDFLPKAEGELGVERNSDDDRQSLDVAPLVAHFEGSLVGDSVVEEKIVECNIEVERSSEKLSQSELVRRFIKEYANARNKDVVGMIKSKYGIEVAPSLVSSIRSKEGFRKPTKTKALRAKKDSKKAVGYTSGSSVIREYLESRPSASNDEVVKEIFKSRKIEVKSTLVSSVRAIMKKKVVKKSKFATRVDKKDAKGRKGLPMPSLVVRVLEKFPREGMKWHEMTDKVIAAGYDYRGLKGYEGIAQNVYQALHALSKVVPHRGYKGKIPVVLHDEMSQRWKLNPKAVKKNVA